MIKKTLIFIVATLFLSFNSHAQSISREVISSGGDAYSNSFLQVSTTIGESVIETLTWGNVILTQGFQQPQLVIVSTQDLVPQNSVIVFPNPTTSSIILDLQDEATILYELVSAEGKVLKSAMTYEKSTEIKMQSLPNSIYFLRLFSKDGEVIQVIKIQKN